MARGVLLLVVLFLLVISPSAAPPWYAAVGKWRAAISSSHALLLRVANARAENGDAAGAARARALAAKLELLSRDGARAGGLWSLLWDYLRNYAWRGGPAAEEIYGYVREIASLCQEFGRLRSDVERARWVGANSPRMASAVKTILGSLSRSVWRSGPLREMVLMLQKEVVDGELLRDCLRVGARDFEALIAIAKDLFFSSSRDSFTEHEYDL
ncbi:adenine phosphoribosyltransferase [Wolffia australiana]